MVNINYKREIPLWVMLVIPFIYCFIIWSHLPDTIPTHFGMNGRPNGWMGRPAIFIMPATGVFLYAVFLVIRLIDPKRKNYESFSEIYYKIRLLLGIFICVLSLIIINSGLTGKILLGMRFFNALIFALFAFLGNYTINVKPNWFIGIRTPWTLSNETVWKKTHLVGGRAMFYGSLICILLTFLLPESFGIVLLIVFGAGISLFATVYSYLLFQKEEKAGENGGENKTAS